MDAKEEKEQHLKLMKQNYENSKSTISELKKEIIDKNHILRKMEDKMKSILKDVDSLSKQNVIFDTYHNNMILLKSENQKLKEQMKETENLKDDIEVKNNLITICSEKIKDNEKKYLMNRKQHLESMKSNEESITVLREELVQLRDEKNNTEVITKKISKNSS